MRLTYILAVVVAATLHASGTALPTTKDSNQAAISNVASAGIVPTEENGGRMLVEEVKEERAGGALVKWLKQQGENLKFHIKKYMPGTHENKLYTDVQQGKRNAEMLKRRDSGIRAAMGN
ncbi:hypothetical protein PHYSODRAFT_286791 [Phytophthora sojae]|uniref:RxLR effector protein n=2 Tax=Phytophthora sojae TaxID=67593 RepID=G4ZVP4_PHYSP|nr:hypothetical protein PHYSODRAFT_286791 [Phytophthora sojae]AEK80933.1 Avh212 [Phytophthora sojae]AEK80934.1 Avh212 [Phytophthora sojae]AEK80935.1 Avh212 [Phytophthora sojae]EGZ11509.1 hypothetical protein PHYSODRAFT_286791 [Phytophthora sojae]|eukprot:XP_009531842.1 hypothetical protein PHYSODRAFT_286791 [Phytophthora sojae]